MSRLWEKYINRQKYQECRLVTAINASYYLLGKTIKYGSDEYEELVDLCGARYGSATCIEKVHKKLGIKVAWSSKSLYDYEKIPLPIEFLCWHKRIGFHSTLIVDQVIKCGTFRITNFKYATSRDGWIFREDLYQFEIRVPNMIKKSYSLFQKI